jgi:hypothetical protein
MIQLQIELTLLLSKLSCLSTAFASPWPAGQMLWSDTMHDEVEEDFTELAGTASSVNFITVYLASGAHQ